jgi:hypothetical protein
MLWPPRSAKKNVPRCCRWERCRCWPRARSAEAGRVLPRHTPHRARVAKWSERHLLWACLFSSFWRAATFCSSGRGVRRRGRAPGGASRRCAWHAAASPAAARRANRRGGGAPRPSSWSVRRPARGTMALARAAPRYGSLAMYLGGNVLGLREKSPKGLALGIRPCHKRRGHVPPNTFLTTC